MGDSLRDQLLKAGFALSRKEPPRATEKRARQERSRGDKPKGTQGDEVDLARAYAIRAQSEKAEHEAAQRRAQRQAEERRERKRRLHELLQGHSLNLPEAERVRHFEHLGKIRRIYVSEEQLSALNRGELGVVVQAGHFILVTRAIALRVQEFAPDAVALLVDPDAAANAAEDDVPVDLMW